MENKVSIIVPNYNGSKLLEKHLPSVNNCMRSGDELIIIDDASTDNSVEFIQKYFIKLRKNNPKKSFVLIQNKKNLRFGASVNKAVKHARHDLIFLINSDVSPHKDCLDVLAKNFVDKDVFAVGCKELEGKEIGGKNKLWFARGLFVHSRADEFSSGETAWASGGSSMFDKAKWLDLGGFDADYYPAYWEDIDLSFRARKKGWKVLFDSEALVNHEHETTNQTAFGQKRMEIMSMRSLIVFLYKHASLKQKLLHFVFLPYHLIFTNLRTHGVFSQSYLLFIREKLHLK